MSRRPLVVTSDPVLLDELLRLCAAAGVDADVAPDLTAARSRWVAAGRVVVGVDAARSVGHPDTGLAVRPGVVVVGADLDDLAWAAAAALGAESVVTLPVAQGWLVDRLGEPLDPTGPVGRVLAVVGGRGGAGASTLAAALGVTAARTGLTTLLVDGDPLGGGIDLLLGGEDTSGLRWPDLAGAGGRVDGASLRASLPSVPGAQQLSVLSWDRGDRLVVPAAAMASVLAAGRRACDAVVVDLPRHVDEATEVVVTTAQQVLVVVPAEVRATAAAARVVAALAPLAADLRAVVRGPAPAGLPARTVAESLGVPLAGWLRSEPGLAAALERGEPPARSGRGPLARLCRTLLADLAPARDDVA